MQHRCHPAVFGGALVTAVLGVASCWAAPPAVADDGLSGTYTYSETGASPHSRTWTLTPCGNGCTHVVASASSTGKTGGFSGDLHLLNGSWEMTVDRPDLLWCPDGRTLPGSTAFFLAPAALGGTRVASWPRNCSGFPGSDQVEFSLTAA